VTRLLADEFPHAALATVRGLATASRVDGGCSGLCLALPQLPPEEAASSDDAVPAAWRRKDGALAGGAEAGVEHVCPNPPLFASLLSFRAWRLSKPYPVLSGQNCQPRRWRAAERRQPHWPREDGLAHPADTRISNLAAALGLLFRVAAFQTRM
jgi:hypothetical protein